MKIECKPVLMNKLIVLVIASIALSSILGGFVGCGSIKSPIPIIQLSMLLTFGSVVLMFYLSKNEVYKIKTDNEILHLDFFNQSFLFKRKPLQLNRAELMLNTTGPITQIHFSNKVIANLRQNSMKPEEWAALHNFILNT